MKKLPIYQLEVSMDDDQSGVSFVALVDDPAIQRNFYAFAGQNKFEFAVTSEEKRIISGPLMVAGMPIYRNDANGEYYVQFSAQSIYTIVKKFFKEGNTSNVNEMHNPRMIADGVYMFESFLIDKSRMSNPKGFEDLPDGSWFGSYKVDNEDIWAKIKSGEFKGFSVEGDFIPKEMNKVSEEALISQITAIIQS